MQFQIGDQVVHPLYGVGTVKTHTRQQFGGEATRQYYEVTTGGPVVWVPIDEHGSTVLRRIASKQSLGECRRLLTSHPLLLDRDRKRRQFEIADRLKDGLLPAKCEMVRDLRAQGQLKPLGITDDALLRKTFKAVCDEWAASDGVTAKSALREIELLLEGKPSDS
ncbi:MAG TPA: CarD family transcriptional regulator [Anaerolineae bacterium]